MQFLSVVAAPESHFFLTSESYHISCSDREKCGIWLKNIIFHLEKFEIPRFHTYIFKLYGFWTVQTESFIRFQNQLSKYMTKI